MNTSTSLAATLATVILLLASQPLHAHPGLALDGPLHRALHFFGTDTVIALGGGLAVLALVWLARRMVRTRRTAPGDAARRG